MYEYIPLLPIGNNGPLLLIGIIMDPIQAEKCMTAIDNLFVPDNNQWQIFLRPNPLLEEHKTMAVM